MKKILAFCSLFFLFSTAVAFALPMYAASPTNPGVVCADCHSDGRTWVAPVTPPPVTPPPVTPPPVTPPPVTQPQTTPPVTGDMNLSASFDESTGILFIPAILVGDQIWSAQLHQSPTSAHIFELLVDDTLTLNNAIDPAAIEDRSSLAHFNPKKGRLDIPLFSDGQDQWRISMKLVGIIPRPTFAVKIANPGTGDLDADELSIDDGTDTDADDNMITEGDQRR